MSFSVNPLAGASASQAAQASQATAVAAAPAAAVPPPAIQFSHPKGFLARTYDAIASKIQQWRGLAAATPAPPQATFALSRTSLKGASTLSVIGNMVFGEPARRAEIDCGQEGQGPGAIGRWARLGQGFGARFAPRLQIPAGGGGNQRLSGFSVSASGATGATLDINRPVVLFLSGSGAPAQNYSGTIAWEMAQNRDCNFVALNYRGFGGSGGAEFQPTEQTVTEDGFAMLNHLLQQGFPPDRIILQGYSMGASVASRLQAAVESSGHQLRGVIYDRPMSSATGAAKGAMEVTQGFGQGLQHLTAAITRVGVGDLSTRRNLQDIVDHGGGLRSPTFLVADAPTVADDNGNQVRNPFGERAASMAEHFSLPTVRTTGAHESQAAAVAAINSLPNVHTIFQ